MVLMMKLISIKVWFYESLHIYLGRRGGAKMKEEGYDAEAKVMF